MTKQQSVQPQQTRSYPTFLEEDEVSARLKKQLFWRQRFVRVEDGNTKAEKTIV